MPIEIEQLLSDARTLGASAFAAKHGPAFLIRSSGDGGLEAPDDDWLDRTNPLPIRSTNYSIPRVSYEMSRAPGSRFFVYPLRKRKPGPPGAPITLGRSLKRDIRLEDLSVSNLHAYVLTGVGGRFQILDKASRNGTRVGAEPLKPGTARALSSGTTVELGRVRTTFMEADALIRFVLDVVV